MGGNTKLDHTKVSCRNVGLHSTGWRQGPVAGYCERGNVLPSWVKDWKYLGLLSNYYIFKKKNSLTWFYFFDLCASAVELVNVCVLTSKSSVPRGRYGISTLKHGCAANIPARSSNVRISNIGTQTGSDIWCSVALVTPSKQGRGLNITHVPCCVLVYNINSNVCIITNFKYSPCCKWCILSFGWFSGVWILCADV